MNEAALLGNELLERRELRANLVSWARYLMKEKSQEPAKHHIVLLEKLQQITDGTLVHSVTGLPCRNLIVLMPRGSAKSTYTSVVFPPWFIQRREHCRILACSHSADLIEQFSRECRNSIERHHKVLGYRLNQDRRSVQEWSVDNGGAYYCAGVGAGIVGRRGDAGVIDDYLGSYEDADSKLVREKRWNWYLSDFWPCLKPNAIQIIVATRWHEEDLVGCLIDPENKYGSPVDHNSWEVVKFPYFAKENDPLGRAEGDKLWPAWFNEQHEAGVRKLPPRIIAGMYQLEPAPEQGDYFKREWLLTYNQDEYDKLMAKNPRIYGAGDWAVSEAKDANRSCLGGAALDEDGMLYILPDIFWKVAGPKEVVNAFVAFMKRRNPLQFYSEKGHISSSWGPFLREQMLEESVYSYITEVTVARAKDVRAQSIRGRMSMLRVKFPAFASWWPQALHELLMFPGGKADDFVDFIAHIGMGINNMSRPSAQRRAEVEDWNKPMPITLSWIKKSDNERKKALEPLYQGR